MYMSCVLETDDFTSTHKPQGRKLRYTRSPLDPTNDVSTETQGIGGIAKATLRAFEHGALIHKAIKHLTALREKVVQSRLGTLQEGVLVQGVLLSARAQKPTVERVFRRLVAVWTCECRGGRRWWWGKASSGGVWCERRAGACGKELGALSGCALVVTGPNEKWFFFIKRLEVTALTSSLIRSNSFRNSA
jgi:hypothetical protein